MADAVVGRLELLAAIKAHSQHLRKEDGAAGPALAIGGWSDDEWRGAFQQLVSLLCFFVTPVFVFFGAGRPSLPPLARLAHDPLPKCQAV